jgi:pimeloyl-ACP methyl ester carboxylesterase
VNDPSEGWQVIVTKANEILDNFVHPHIPGLVDAAVEIWPWLLAGWVAATIVFVLFLLGVYSSTPDAPRWVITRDLKVQDHCVVTDDGAILRGISKGSGPSILLLHGAGCSSDIFTFLFKRFSLRGYRVYAFDLRGHGVSNDVAHLSAKVLADDLHAVLKDLDLTLTTIIGHGLGGYAALAFALYYPSSAATRIGRLVLLSSFAKMPDEMHSTTGKAVRMLVGAGMLHLSLRWRSAARYLMRPFFGRGVTETLQEEWRRAVLSCPRKVWKQGLNAGGLHSRLIIWSVRISETY